VGVRREEVGLGGAGVGGEPGVQTQGQDLDFQNLNGGWRETESGVDANGKRLFSLEI
jgi:hypothetical protein